MKVTVLYPHVNANVQKTKYGGLPHQPATLATGSSDKISEGDSVQLSNTVRELQQATKSEAPDGDIQAAKVQEIKRQIREGSYRIDSEKIAAKMLEDPFLSGVD